MSKKEIKKPETNEMAENQLEAGGSKGMRIVKAVFNTIINILIVAVLIVSIVVATLSLTSKADPNGLPNVFGYTFQYVQTNSMNAEPPEGFEGGNFSDKDVIICKTYSVGSSPEIKIGDIVTFKSDIKDDEGNVMMITHRVIDAQENNGETVYQTKGDANENVDQRDLASYLRADRIVSVFYSDSFKGKILKGFADFFRTLRSPGGFFGIILIPMIIFFLYAIIRVVISALNYKKGLAEDAKEEAEKEKEEAVKAAVAAALAAKNEIEAKQAQAEEKPAEKAEEKSADMTPDQMEQFKQFLAFQQAQKAQQSDEKPAENAAPDQEEG